MRAETCRRGEGYPPGGGSVQGSTAQHSTAQHSTAQLSAKGARRGRGACQGFTRQSPWECRGSAGGRKGRPLKRKCPSPKKRKGALRSCCAPAPDGDRKRPRPAVHWRQVVAPPAVLYQERCSGTVPYDEQYSGTARYKQCSGTGALGWCSCLLVLAGERGRRIHAAALAMPALEWGLRGTACSVLDAATS